MVRLKPGSIAYISEKHPYGKIRGIKVVVQAAGNTVPGGREYYVKEFDNPFHDIFVSEIHLVPEHEKLNQDAIDAFLKS